MCPPCAVQDPSLHPPPPASPLPPWLQAEWYDAGVPGSGSSSGRGPPPLWATPVCSGPAPGNRPAGGADVSASAPGCHFWWPGKVWRRQKSTAWREKQMTINYVCFMHQDCLDFHSQSTGKEALSKSLWRECRFQDFNSWPQILVINGGCEATRAIFPLPAHK